MNTDWNGDGLIDERDRFAEVCNWTGATIDFNDDYWLTYNGGAYRPVQRRKSWPVNAPCSGSTSAGVTSDPIPGGVYKLWNRDTGLVSAFTANTGAADRCYQRNPLGRRPMGFATMHPGEPSATG